MCFLRQMTLYLYCILICICLFLSFNSTQVHSWNVGCLSNTWRLEDGECIIFVEIKAVCQLQINVEIKAVCQLQIKLTHQCHLHER